MGLQTIMNDAKARFDALSSRGSKSAKTSVEGLREVNGIVIGGVQTLVKGQAEGARELFDSLRAGVSKARADGLRAVAGDPLAYLPPRKKVAGLYDEAIDTVSQTGEDLTRTLRERLEQLRRELNGEVAKPARRKARTVAHKAASKGRKTVRKTTRKVNKAADKAAETITETADEATRKS